MICWKCRRDAGGIAVHRTTECPHCGADLHACKGCAFYSPGSHYDCHERVEEAVRDKERANFCDWFRAAERADGSGADRGAAARDAFARLFG